MKKSNSITLVALLMGVSLNTLAATDMDNVRDRLTMLENAKNTSGLSIGGELGIIYDNDDTQNQDIFIDTAELLFIYTVDERFQAEVVIEGEDTDNDRSVDNVEVSDVILTAQFEKFGVLVGRYDAPFVADETGFISDTTPDNLTTGVKALSVNTEFDGWSAIAWIAPNKNSNNCGVAVSYEADNFAIGVDTIKHALGGADNNATNTAAIGRGVSIHGKVTFSDITLIAERSKVNNQTTADVSYTQLEAQYTIAGVTLMLRSDGSDKPANEDDATLVGAAYDLAEGINISIEHKNPKAGDSITRLQLVYAF